MGNCLASLFGRSKRPRSYFTGRYKDYNVGVEFDNLIEDENHVADSREVVSQTEKDLLINRQFSKLVENQRRVDAEIDAVLHQEEEQTRLEEEAYITANKEAARIARQTKQLHIFVSLHQEEERTRLEEEAYIAAKKEAARIARQTKRLEEEKKKRKPVSNGSVNSWAGDDGDWSIANEEEDDFDSFLQTVTARSENVRASVASLSNASTNSFPAHVYPNNTQPLIPMTSDLLWQDLIGLGGLVDVKHAGIPSTSTNQMPFPDSTSSDLFSSQKSDTEWEANFVSAEIEAAPSLPVGAAGDAQSIFRSEKELHQNGDKNAVTELTKDDSGGLDTRGRDQESETFAKDRDSGLPSSSNDSVTSLPREKSARGSFSITDEEEEDDDILDIRSESTNTLKDDVPSVLEEGSKDGPTIEAEAFDIDIDKFLEELDAEL